MPDVLPVLLFLSKRLHDLVTHRLHGYEITVRSSVWMKASTGMPGTSLSPRNRATSSPGMLKRAK